MSAHSSAASAASTSDWSEPVCASCGSAKPSRSDARCCESIGLPSLAIRTFRKWGGKLGQLTFSPEASLVKTSVTLGAVGALAGQRAAYGLSSPESLTTYDPVTCSWRTSQVSLLEEWAEFSEIWPMSGTTRNGTAYRLRPLAPYTYELESGFWPTPVSDDTGVRTKPYSQGGTPLSYIVRGPLNPNWIEWLMGFPIGWSELQRSETPSSRKSRNGSAGASSSPRRRP